MCLLAGSFGTMDIWILLVPGIKIKRNVFPVQYKNFTLNQIL